MTIPTMPDGIRAAILQIKKTIAPAMRTAELQDGEDTVKYASADDVFTAAQKAMAEAGLIIDLIRAQPLDILAMSMPGGEMQTAIHLQFIPVYSWVNPGDPADSADFEDTRNVIDMIAPWEGNQGTVAAMRTLAMKTHLRNLLKLPTTAAEAAAGQGAVSPAAFGGKVARVDPNAPEADGRRKPRNPLTMSAQDSASARELLISNMLAAANTDGDTATRIAAIGNAFTRDQVIWTRLTRPDQEAVKAERARLIQACADEAGQAA